MNISDLTFGCELAINLALKLLINLFAFLSSLLWPTGLRIHY